MIQLTVIGHIGQDAEVKDASGKKVINFSVAHSESYLNAQGVKESRTTWVKCAIWKDASSETKIANYLKKGVQVMVQGVPSTESFINNDNKAVANLRLRVAHVELLGKSESNGQ